MLMSRSNGKAVAVDKTAALHFFIPCFVLSGWWDAVKLN